MSVQSQVVNYSAVFDLRGTLNMDPFKNCGFFPLSVYCICAVYFVNDRVVFLRKPAVSFPIIDDELLG